MSSRLQASHFGLRSDATRPVMFALISAFVENMNGLTEIAEKAGALLATQSDAKDRSEEAVLIAQDAVRHGRNLTELIPWVYPRRVMPIEEATKRDRLFMS